ncbi:MAG: glycosyl transferase, family 2 [Candidatus Nomurabacteria bacterium]|nr:glycosyl transferase, family 2 [Candidatus Nomurabacteria bacterium]
MDNKAEKIAAIVVTFNRKDLLPKCLDGILKQTRPVDHIFLIDNASTDGTKEIVEELYKNNPLISYTILPENSGSAGGFHEGVKAAYEEGMDWIWFLDDDVSPRSNCLEKMLEYSHISKCMHPSKLDVNGEEFLWESLFDTALGRVTFIPNLSFKNGKDFTFVNVGCFEGMFIHRDIVEKIGFPDKRFFIGGDDTMYGFSASLYTNVIFIKDAIINKLIPFGTVMKPTAFYYSLRNQFLVKDYLKKYELFKPNLFYWYFTLYVLYVCTKHTYRNRSLRIPLYVVKAIIDGNRKKFYKL